MPKNSTEVDTVIVQSIMKANTSLWPAEQLLVTADTSRAVSAVLQPSQQLKFLRNVSELVGPNLFAESLVYSTPENNTGWTAFRMGPSGHVSYHHWDHAAPNLLQFDAFSLGSLDFSHVLQLIRSSWLPMGQRAHLIRRDYPDKPLHITELSNDLGNRPRLTRGLGPGDHLHLMIDQTATATSHLDELLLDAAVAELAKELRMRCMTPVMSRYISHGDSFAYDAIVGITTSHISLRARVAEGLTSLSLDVFSCKEFRPEVVTSWLDALFNKTELRRAVLYNKYPVGTFTTLV